MTAYARKKDTLFANCFTTFICYNNWRFESAHTRHLHFLLIQFLKDSFINRKCTIRFFLESLKLSGNKSMIDLENIKYGPEDDEEEDEDWDYEDEEDEDWDYEEEDD